MQLTESLRLLPGSAAAFTGAGGKSNSLKRLAFEGCYPPSVLATTTKIFRHQKSFAAEHRILNEHAQLEGIYSLLHESSSLFLTGPGTENRMKWTGVEPGLLQPVYHEVKRIGGILAIEADGARGGSLKAPADYEPVIPDFVDLVVHVAGIDVLGLALDSPLIHRPQLVEEIVGKVDQVTPAAVAAVISSQRGGLKGVPAGAAVRVLINKIEDELSLQQGRDLARLLLEEPRIQSVLLAAVANQDPVREVHSRTGAVVLAAGEARRFGGPKQLQEWQGETFVHRAARTAIEAGLEPVLVVTGAYDDQVRSALEDLPVGLIHNPDWGSGQGSSVRAAARKLPDNVDAACFLLADMPAVDVGLVQALLERYRQTLASITAPVFEGRQGNPVLFDRRTFSDLSELSGEEGGRTLFHSYDVEHVPWDHSILTDIDTAEDFRHLNR